MEPKMRDYQRKKNNKYRLPSTVYHQTIWMIRDYYRMKQEANAILTESSAALDGMPHSGKTVDVVTRKAIKRETLIAKVSAIDAALSDIHAEYRKPIWENVLHGKPYPANADRSTYGRNKAKFIASAAKRLGLYDDF